MVLFRFTLPSAGFAYLLTLALPGLALAVPGYSTAFLNLRSGPGTEYPVVGVMEYNVRSQITGCLADYSWCEVNVAGLKGWASAEYLVVDKSGQVLQITGPDSGIPVIEALGITAPATPATVGVIVRANGDVAAIVPEPAVTEYIATTPVNPFAVKGEVVVGAVLPPAVTLYEVPGSVYGYTIVNGSKVLVDANSRAVVYVHRNTESPYPSPFPPKNGAVPPPK